MASLGLHPFTMMNHSLQQRAGLLLLLASAFFLGLLTDRATRNPGAADADHAVSPPKKVSQTITVRQTASVEPSQERELENFRDALPRAGVRPTTEKQRDELMKMISSWALENPDEALAYVRATFHSPEQQSQAMASILSDLATKKPQEAWQWTVKNVPTDMQCVEAVLNQIGQKDTLRAWSYARQFGEANPPEASSACASVLRGACYAGNYKEAARLAGEAGDLTARREANFGNLIVSQWGRYQPEAALDWVESLPPGPDRDSTLTQLGEAWSEADPQGAANFAVSLSEEGQRGAVLTQVVGHWASKDPVAAAEWVGRFEAGPEMDQVMAEIATLPSISDRGIAATWANRITNRELRLQSLTRIYSMWMVNNPEAARADLIHPKNLSPETGREILARLAN